MRTVIIGDPHGCVNELDELLKLVDYKSKNIRVIIAGDSIDRGYDSVGVIRRCRELKIESVMGNHEHKFIKWYQNKRSKYNIDEQHKHYLEFSDKDIDYLFKLPLYIKLKENLYVIHAGARPNIPIEKQKKEDLMFLRFYDSNGKSISIAKINEAGSREAVDAHFWTEFWKGPESIIYGHHVHYLDSPLIEEVAPGVTCYGLDTGCCFGGALSGLIVETGEIVQVKAKENYYNFINNTYN